MKWTIFDDAWMIFAVGLLGLSLALGSCDTASACGRCRAGYRVCHAPIVQKQVVERIVDRYIPQQTIIFNNAYPAAAPGGTSYQSFAADFAPSANGLIALASQQATASSQVAALARDQAATEASLAALAIERDKIVAISEHLRAGLSGGGGGSQTLILQLGADGSVRRVEPETVRRPPAGDGDSSPAGSLVERLCAKCHGGAQPKGEFYLDGRSPVSDAAFRAAVAAIAGGQMPPASEPELTAEQRAGLLSELLSLKPE